jgi:hypothetical protein
MTMTIKSLRLATPIIIIVAMVAHAASAQIGRDDVKAAIATIRTIDRPGRDNLATVWDGNKYIQCRRMRDASLRCEAAGALMQVSLERVLTPERIGRLAAMGWTLDPSFGNYVQTFGADVSAEDIADKILAALSQGYGADMQNLEVETKSIASEPCPPRNGQSADLAGIIIDAREMTRYAVHACAYKPKSDEPKRKLGPSSTAADLIELYGPQVAAEIGRLRINTHRRAFVILSGGLGYVQCHTQMDPDGFYCEAQSTDTWPALAAVLTPERIARLHAAGFADPGRAPNYSKTYLVDKISDAVLAAEALTLLHDVYGYYGATKLEVTTEED